MVYQVIRSNRSQEWMMFSRTVYAHIEDYTVPQYGDSPNDQIEEWSPEDCIKQIQKYCNRFGRNSRGRKERLTDLLKIAHYAAMAYSKEAKEISNL